MSIFCKNAFLPVLISGLGGRNHETFGEDPYVLGRMGAAYVNGKKQAYYTFAS